MPRLHHELRPDIGPELEQNRLGGGDFIYTKIQENSDGKTSGPKKYIISVLIIFFFYGNRNTGIFAVLYCVVVYTMLHSHNPSQSLKSPAMIIVSMMLLISTIVSGNKY